MPNQFSFQAFDFDIDLAVDGVGPVTATVTPDTGGSFPLSNGDASYGTQIIGIVSYGVFAFVASGIVWFILKSTMGIRVSDEEEALGLDKVEIGVEAYPEFGTGSQRL